MRKKSLLTRFSYGNVKKVTSQNFSFFLKKEISKILEKIMIFNQKNEVPKTCQRAQKRVFRAFLMGYEAEKPICGCPVQF